MVPTEKTKKFINGVNALIDSGLVSNHTEIINALDWNKTMFSSVLNGRKNVPNVRYRKFKEVYQIDDSSLENFTVQEIRMVRMMCEVIVSVVGEILAVQRGQPAGKVIEGLQEMINEKLANKPPPGNGKVIQIGDKTK